MQNKVRGRPKKQVKEGDLLLQLEKKKKTKEEAVKFLLRFATRISNKGRLTMSDFKYIHHPRSNAMFDVKKYGLTWKDPLIKHLREQCKKPPSIGIMSLTELEAVSGVLPQGGERERKLLDGMEYMTASLIYANPDYIDKVTDNYWQYDMSSAYGFQLINNPMPTTYKCTKKGRIFANENEVCVYVDALGNATFDFFDMNIQVVETIVYNAEYICGDFVKKWYNIKQDPEYRKLAKDIIVCSIGAIHKYRQNLIARYVWFKQKQYIYNLVEICEKMGCTVIKVHTDSIGYIQKKGFIFTLGVENDSEEAKELGALVLEHKDTSIYLVSAGQYQIKDKKPRLSGINWGGTFIERQEGERLHWKVFPCIKKGDVIKSYEKDGVEWKTLGADIEFKKGEE